MIFWQPYSRLVYATKRALPTRDPPRFSPPASAAALSWLTQLCQCDPALDSGTRNPQIDARGLCSKGTKLASRPDYAPPSDAIITDGIVPGLFPNASVHVPRIGVGTLERVFLDPPARPHLPAEHSPALV
ncbi:unnamed protein product, partial [Iphiclides podalirius]